MKNIFIVLTDQQSRLYYDYYIGKYRLGKKMGVKNYYIYITSDEEIKVGDYVLDIVNAEVMISKGKMFDNPYIKKIILTTDPTLIADSVQAIDDTFLEWFVKNPTCESVEVEKLKLCIQTGSPCGMQCFSEETCNENIIYKIIIPQEEHKRKIDTCYNFNKEIGCVQDKCRCEDEEPKCQCIRPDDNTCDYCDNKESKVILEEAKKETLKVAAINYSSYNEQINKAVQEAVIFGADWQSKRMYSEIELRDLIIKALTHDDDKLCGSLVTKDKEIRTANFGVWFEENKKK
jgi:hypothetical protein